MNQGNQPPAWLLRFFRSFCDEAMHPPIEGDLLELYNQRRRKRGKRLADLRFFFDVLLLFRPGIIRPLFRYRNVNHYCMLKSYFTIGWRNLLKSKGYSMINIAGLSVGMGVVLLIGLWIFDELSYDRNSANYDRVVRVMVNHNFNGEISTQWSQPLPLGKELRDKFSDDFALVSMTSWSYGHFLQWEDKKLSAEGTYVEPSFLQMNSVKMIQGSLASLNDPHTIILNASLARTIFGDVDPIGKMMKIDNYSTVSVTGIFEDLPDNSSFASSKYFISWALYVTDNDWARQAEHNWGNHSFQVLAQLQPHADIKDVEAKISDVTMKNNPRAESKPNLILHPMSKWHLYAEFQNGVNTGGAIQFVWLFGIIGTFVLVLACINFMNLSTARSEKRAKEVGLRKVIGSMRGQLVVQFLSESLFVSFIAVLLSLVMVQLSLGWFNELTEKQIVLPVNNAFFWIFLISSVLFTGLLAGSYPALYLSSFKPIKILKGTFATGHSASIPRKTLIVVQFTVSIILMIGTVVVHRQIMHAKDRPLGYDYSGLVTTYGYPFSDRSSNPGRYDYLKNELIKTGAVVKVGKSSSPTTGVYSNQSDFEWEDKDPNVYPNFGVVWCSHDYGDAIGLEYAQGRGFSREFATDTAAIILNEAALDFMGLKDPIGKIIRFDHTTDLHVIGIAKNVLMESPYDPIRPVVYMINYNSAQVVTLKLNPDLPASTALSRIEPVFKKFNPESIFEYQFVDQEFGKKFANEERIGKLSNVFAGLAIFISCVGIFGLASFLAEQRTKEIGIRKILGAPIFALWMMLSKDFVALVTIACGVSIPAAYFFLNRWLEKYTYHTDVSIGVLASVGVGAMLITLLTVSYQSIRAARMNPVRSLRSE